MYEFACHTDPTAAISSSISVPFVLHSALSSAFISWVNMAEFDTFFSVAEDFFLDRNDADVEL